MEYKEKVSELWSRWGRTICAGVAVLVLMFFLVMALPFSVFNKDKGEVVGALSLEDITTVTIRGEISSEHLAQVQSEIMTKHKSLPAGVPMYLFMDSNGGDVEAGLNFVSFLHGLDRPFHTVNQWSASMAFIIAQLLRHRYVTRYGQLFNHPASFSNVRGTIPGSLSVFYNHYIQRLQDIDIIIARRAGTDVKQYRDRLLSDILLGSFESVREGFADAVVDVRCGDSMVGTYTRTLSRRFLGVPLRFKIEYNKCPLISEPVSVSLATADYKKTIDVNAAVQAILEELRGNSNIKK